ncbi:respiratory nitrate reductase subunit gamma [Effusibacillus lacus]|uniref:Nitrate reductase n=1 Tax=Effusibacillus lacus TaxID=1348429 RepID=A0A292YSK2_9BACL|nr:respiratory nitrate reductase subunit gamma [Effusibacillus lacus]TCS76080.1 nitrate reductase gamma subunit [Effusibacillus lacus]GAX91404.1 nitrate reductase [Effusibacillus lacus]
MSALDQFLWVIYPYMMLTIFVVGHIYRYKTDQLAWTAKSSEFLEKKSLKWGSMLFHIGIFLVFLGHVAGLLVPKAVTEAFGISERLYHLGAVYGGTLAGLMTVAGISILLFRRVTNKRVRITSSTSDMLVAILLFAVIGMGLLATVGHNMLSSYDYRVTISPWVRGILTFTPDASLMTGVPIFFKLHVLLAFAIFGVWPFTRLVHVWSVPLAYFRRSYILYRSRNTHA